MRSMMHVIVNFHALKFGYACPIIIEILNCDMPVKVGLFL
jgi:hypothetical protein